MSLFKLELNWDNFKENLLYFKNIGQANQEIMPVIKANAYGHGLEEAIKVINGQEIQKIAVGSIHEALASKNFRFGGKIVALLGFFEEDDLEIFSHNQQIVPLVHNFESLKQALAHSASEKLPIALKFDSGMGRLGFHKEDLAELVQILSQQNKVEALYFLTHFSSADVPKELAYTESQLKKYAAAYNFMKNYFPNLQSSLGNTAMILADSKNAGNIMRSGLGLYGGNPFQDTEHENRGQSLKQVMSAYTKIMAIHNIPAQTSLGYARSFISSKPMTVAVIGIGYADGYARSLSKGGKEYKSTKAGVIINDCFAPILPNVAMQMTVVDVTNLNCKCGDKAYVLGSAEGNKNKIDIYSLAAWWGTIPHEVTCSLGQISRLDFY